MIPVETGGGAASSGNNLSTVTPECGLGCGVGVGEGASVLRVGNGLGKVLTPEKILSTVTPVLPLGTGLCTGTDGTVLGQVLGLSLETSVVDIVEEGVGGDVEALVIMFGTA